MNGVKVIFFRFVTKGLVAGQEKATSLLQKEWYTHLVIAENNRIKLQFAYHSWHYYCLKNNEDLYSS